MSKFQIITIAIFIVCIIAGVALFATYKSKDNDNALPTITMWGTFPATTVNSLMQKMNNTSKTQISINYTEKTEETFDRDFIEALARGDGPDSILIPQSMILRYPMNYSLKEISKIHI